MTIRPFNKYLKEFCHRQDEKKGQGLKERKKLSPKITFN